MNGLKKRTKKQTINTWMGDCHHSTER